MKSRIIITAAAGLASTGLAAAPAAAATTAMPHASAPASVKFTESGSCRAAGSVAAACVATGNMTRPTTIHVHTTTSPRQKITVTWAAACGKGTSAAEDSGHFTVARGDTNHTIRHPFATTASNCSVDAEGSIGHNGHIHVWLTYWKRSA
jgi:hypothetical protein